MKKTLFFLTAFFIAHVAYNQCPLSTTQWPPQNVTSPTPTGITVTISTNNWLGDFTIIDGMLASSNYEFDIDTSGFVTIYNGLNVVTYGPTPFTFNPPTNGTYTIQWNGELCATESFNDHITTITNLGLTTQCSSIIAGTTISSNESPCANELFNVSLSGNLLEEGLSYQWQSSLDGIAFTDVVGATFFPFTTSLNINNVSKYFRCKITCSNGGSVDYSTPVLVTIGCFNMFTGNITICGGNFYDSGGEFASYQDDETHTLTVYPATPGMKVRVAFSSFLVEDTFDSLLVYNGNSTSSPLIGSYFTNPGIITSSASDGSLTFVFNSDFSNVEAGWKATFSCFDATPCVDPAQPGTVIGSNLVCMGEAFELNLDGASTSFGMEYQWQSSTDGITFTDITGETDTILNISQNVATYYRCVSTCSGGTAVISSALFVEFGTCYTMTNGNITTCDGLFFDTGGQNNTYQDNETYTLTVYPATPGAMLRVNFSSFLVEDSYDSLIIYNGNSTSSPMIGSYFINPGIITSSASDGSLTFVFNSDFSNVDAGWEATFSCYNSTPCVNPVQTGTTASSSNNVCASDPFDLSISGVIDGLGMTYQWQSSVDGISFDDIIGETDTVLSTTQSSTTYYRCVATCSAGTPSPTTAIVISMQTPIVDAGPDLSVCEGTDVTLTGSSPLTMTYQWNNGVVDGIPFQLNATTIFTLTGETQGGCTASDQVTVTVLSSPTADAGSDQMICAGETITLNGAGSGTISWDNSVQNGTAFVPNATTMYTLSVLDNSNGCSSSDSVLVTVNPLPTVYAGEDQVICPNTAITLTGTSASGSLVYTWDNGVVNGVPFVPVPNASTTYTLSGTSVDGCTDTDQVVVTVLTLPTINAGSDQIICLGAAITLSASGANQFTWDNGVVDGVSFVPNATTTYTVTVTGLGDCNVSDQVTVTVNFPSTNTITTTAQDSFTLNGQVYTATGTYMQTLTNANGCDSTIVLNLTINSSGLDETYMSSLINLYPNPSNGIVYLEVSSELIGMNYEIVDAVGKVIAHGVLQTEQNQLDLSALGNGIYMFKLQNNSRSSSIRILKQY